jgi:hypothetical protein
MGRTFALELELNWMKAYAIISEIPLAVARHTTPLMLVAENGTVAPQ